MVPARIAGREDAAAADIERAHCAGARERGAGVDDHGRLASEPFTMRMPA